MAESAYGFRMKVENLLRTRAQSMGMNPQRLQRELVCQRLLARLLVVAPDRWALKGGIALDFRIGGLGRTTRDLDLVWLESEAHAAHDLLEVQTIDLIDHFSFEIARVPLRADIEELAARYRVNASLAGRRYADVPVDIGFQDGILGPPDLVAPPSYLHLPGLDTAPIPTIPIEQHIAEKMHAYTRIYASGPSSRVKDLVDLMLCATYASPVALRLARALSETFRLRDMHPIPSALPPPPEQWAVSFRQQSKQTGAHADVAEGYRRAAEMLDPILGSTPPSGTWSPSEGQWGESA